MMLVTANVPASFVGAPYVSRAHMLYNSEGQEPAPTLAGPCVNGRCFPGSNAFHPHVLLLHDGKLNTLGKDTEWLEDPKVFGNYNVAYVSSGSSQRGNPAGGRWRGRVGRCLFRSVQQQLIGVHGNYSRFGENVVQRFFAFVQVDAAILRRTF